MHGELGRLCVQSPGYGAVIRLRFAFPFPQRNPWSKLSNSLAWLPLNVSDWLPPKRDGTKILYDIATQNQTIPLPLWNFPEQILKAGLYPRADVEGLAPDGALHRPGHRNRF